MVGHPIHELDCQFSRLLVASVMQYTTQGFTAERSLPRTCWAYRLNSGVCTCLSATASAPIWWLCGPPCKEGKTCTAKQEEAEKSASEIGSCAGGRTVAKRVSQVGRPGNQRCGILYAGRSQSTTKEAASQDRQTITIQPHTHKPHRQPDKHGQARNKQRLLSPQN